MLLKGDNSNAASESSNKAEWFSAEKDSEDSFASPNRLKKLGEW